MSIVFAIRGDSTTARYATGVATPGVQNSAGFSVSADAGALSGSLINMNVDVSNSKWLVYQSYLNMFEGRAFSLLLRIKSTYTGAPLTNFNGFLTLGNEAANGLKLTFFHRTTTGNISVTCRDNGTGIPLNAVTMATAWMPTANTYYDIVFTWDGTTGSNAAKFYIDASSAGTATAASALSSSLTSLDWGNIYLGFSPGATQSDFKFDEFVIWDSVIDPTSVGLVSGTGSLNGASRTSLVDVAAFNGYSYSDPGIASVKTGTNYTYAGASLTGTYDGSDRWTDPGESNVKTAIAYKANSTSNNKTGTYTGSDRWTDPGVANVRLSTAYKADSTTNNRTGVLNLPQTANVVTGVTYDNAGQTGTYDAAIEVISTLLPLFLEEHT